MNSHVNVITLHSCCPKRCVDGAVVPGACLRELTPLLTHACADNQFFYISSGIVGASCVVVAALAANERRRAARKGVESGSALLAAAP